jgi:phosphoribosylaminoimidazole-succinocarboxamide synthase
MENTHMRELVYKGSTKDIYEYSAEELIFSFSDRYSIFDYGEMPNTIEKKGENTALLNEYLFSMLSKELNISTHFLKKGPHQNELIVKRFNVPRDFDHSLFYSKKPKNVFVPLEVIFRFGVPKGSSLLKQPGFTEGDIFNEARIEFTTKLESIDRHLTESEAMQIASLSKVELSKLKETTILIANKLKEKIFSAGLILWDGKFEFAFSENSENGHRSFVLVDSISLDELRITLDGFPLSKEILRQIYKNTPWYKELIKYKSIDKENFRSKVNKPDPIDEKTMQIISQIYQSTQNLISNKNSNINELKKLIEELKNEYPDYW